MGERKRVSGREKEGERERNVYYCNNVVRRGEKSKSKERGVSGKEREREWERERNEYYCTNVARRGEKSKSKELDKESEW